MKPSSRNSILAAAVSAAFVGLAAWPTFADTPITAFTPGDLVVVRGGDSSFPDTAISTNEVAVYLDEYTTAGTYVGTVNVDSSGDANALTLPGVGDFQHEGLLNLSTNGQWITFAGYNAAAGTPDAFTNAAIGKRIGEVSQAASTLGTSTVVNSYGAGSANPYIRGAYTNDGQEFWAFGKFPANNATSNGGLTYVSGTGPSATSTTIEGFADWRDIIAVNGQLYGGTGSSSVGNHGPYQISTGEPTTNLGNSMSVNTQLGSYAQSASALALLDVPITAGVATQNGVDVLYTIGDQGPTGITKYYFNGTTWVNQAAGQVALNDANNVVNPTGLIAVPDPSNSNWVDLTVSGTNGIYSYIDKGGPTGTIADGVFTQIVSAPANEQFYGIAPAPTAAVPEPASLGLLGIAGIGLLLRRPVKSTLL